jgi:hypothetical protein
MMHECNPVVKQINEARKTEDYTKKYCIVMASYGKYALKDQEGTIYGEYSDIASIVQAEQQIKEFDKDLKCKH